ncbi:MAG TPA: AraC family transcriptional regulator [Planctomycetota bacterium]|nr:AraC family transcriptional regulator [Planctomycetota bacterium]
MPGSINYNTGFERLLAEASFNCEIVTEGVIRRQWVPQTQLTSSDKLYVVYSGKGVARLNNSEFQVRGGDVFLIPSGTLQQGFTDEKEPLHKSWIHFETTTSGSLKLMNLFPPPMRLGGESARQIAVLNKELLEEWRMQCPARQLAVKSLLMRILLIAYRAPEKDIRPPEGTCSLLSGLPEKSDSLQRLPVDRIRRVLSLINEKFAQPLTLSQLAECAHLHPAYFTKVFKRLIGMPPIKYLEQQRLRQSQELLSRTEIPVSEVAARVGYADPFHFSRAFRRLTGRAPSAFREEAQRASSEGWPT